MYLSALALSATIICGVQARLEMSLPTGQCWKNEAIGKRWSCDLGFAGCRWDGVDVPADNCTIPIYNSEDAGFKFPHNFCADNRSALILPPPNAGETAMDGDICSDMTDYYGDKLRWLYAIYDWQCCSCPPGFVGAGSYDVSIDGYNGLTYPYDSVNGHGGPIEKTCMRCTGAGEKLTYDKSLGTFSCGGTTTSTSHKPTKHHKPTKKPTHTSHKPTQKPTHTSKSGGSGSGDPTTKKSTTTPKPTHKPTKKHTTKKPHTTKKHHSTKAALVARVTQF